MTNFPNVERVYISFKDRPTPALYGFLTYLKAFYPYLMRPHCVPLSRRHATSVYPTLRLHQSFEATPIILKTIPPLQMYVSWRCRILIYPPPLKVVLVHQYSLRRSWAWWSRALYSLSTTPRPTPNMLPSFFASLLSDTYGRHS